MKPHFYLRLAIKLAALVLYVMQLHDFGTGQLFHMAAGGAVCVLTVTGLALDRRNLHQMRQNYKSGTISTTEAVLLSSETVIAVTMIIIMATGIVNLAAIPDFAARMTIHGIHSAMAYLMPIVMAVRITIQLVQWWVSKRKNKE